MKMEVMDMGMLHLRHRRECPVAIMVRIALSPTLHQQQQVFYDNAYQAYQYFPSGQGSNYNAGTNIGMQYNYNAGPSYFRMDGANETPPRLASHFRFLPDYDDDEGRPALRPALHIGRIVPFEILLSGPGGPRCLACVI